MNENSNFTQLLNSIESNQYIGLGNPNPKLLFIGKEAGIDIADENFHGSPKAWKENNFDYSARYEPEEPKLRNLNHTWQKYQKLYDSIMTNLTSNYPDKSSKYEISFVENVFTTELSNLHAKNTAEAKKQTNFGNELNTRKNVFFKSDFINQFPIVVIFASDNKYIETYPGEVCEIFNVKFDKLHDENAKDKIWIHSNISENDSPKLVIHTRQLTNSITPDLISNLSNLIVNFIKNESITI